MAGAPRLLALATATPRYEIRQQDAEAMAGVLFAGIRFGRFAPVFENAAIERRHSCVPISWYGAEHGFAEKNALDLLESAARDALQEAGLGASEIDAIVTVSSTGVATPALDARLMRRLP